MIGTIVNCIAVIAGALLGSLIGARLPVNLKNTVMQGIGLVVILIGLKMAIATQHILLLTLSMVLGGVAGELMGIEDKLNACGQWLEKRFAAGHGQVARAFVTASLVYCVGAMAIMGSIEEGLTGKADTLYVKSVLDGVTAIVFASVMGKGVAFSAIAILLYQGLITLAASAISQFLSTPVITEMTAAGGLLIVGIGLTMLEIKQLRVGNLLPAIFIAAILMEIKLMVG